MPERQSYDPYRLIDDVEGLLIQRGYRPERLEGHAGERVSGASQLLRGLGLEPFMNQGEALDLDGNARYSARAHRD
jgi:hypothetical protein